MLRTYRLGRIEVLPTERRLLVDGQPAAVGSRALDLLLALLERRDRVVGKGELLDLVWPNVVVEENNLQVHISALRKLLGPDAISTIPGRGYRLALATTDDDTAPRPEAGATTHAAPSEPPTTAGNVPLAPTALIGRDADLTELRQRLEQHALVTIVGASGMGKTSLALATALALRGRWRDGAWWVELAPVVHPASLPQAVAHTLQVALGAAPEPEAGRNRLVEALRGREMLLVLDNCEHVLEAAAELATAIVSHAPGVRVLATSQELLGVRGEQVMRIAPLPVPEGVPTPDVGRDFPALRLFGERARAVEPGFALDASNVGDVVEICRQLDGMPLAIELAAARVRLLGVHGLRERLGERFRVLTGGARTAMRRHQTLRAAIAWSHGLLDAAERAVFRRLGVFVGGFSLELAQRVCADDALDAWAVLDALSALVDKSLVVAEAGAAPRYRLLESTRAYALEQLADVGESDAWLRRHAEAVGALFVQAEEARYGEHGAMSGQAFMDRLTAELDNARAALDWAAAHDAALAIALAGAIAPLLNHLGLAHEALHRLAPLRERIDDRTDPHDAGRFWLHWATLGNNGRLPKAHLDEVSGATVDLYRRLGARRRLLQALYGRSWTANQVGDFAAARALLPEIAGLERADDPAWLRSQRLHLEASILNHEGDAAAGAELLERRLAILERADGEDELCATAEANLCLDYNGMGRFEDAIARADAMVARFGERRPAATGRALYHRMFAQLALGRIDEAMASTRASIARWNRDELLLYGAPAFALLLAEQGRLDDAARLDGAAMAYLQRSGAMLIPIFANQRGRLERLLAAGATPPQLARWRQEGEALDATGIEALVLGRPAG